MTETLLSTVESFLERYYGDHRVVRGVLLEWTPDLTKEDLNRMIAKVERQKIMKSYDKFNEFLDAKIAAATGSDKI